MPLTGGFFGKFYIFKAALESHLVWLTVLGLAQQRGSGLLLFYLRILVLMYMKEPSEAVEKVEPLSPGMSAALILRRWKRIAASVCL